MDSPRPLTVSLRRRSIALGTALILGASTAIVAAVPASSASTTTPRITSQPKSTSVVSGSKATFSVKATGGSLKYQWSSKKPGSTKWVALTTSTAKSSTLKVSTKATMHGTQYRVVVTNKLGKKTSSAAKLTVQTTPKITTQPVSGYSETGKSRTLSVKATGNSLKYQWYTKATSGASWTKVAGATSSSYKFTTKTGTRYYLVKVKNSAGSKNSSSAKIMGMAAPKVTTQPESQAVDLGKSATLTVASSGNSLSFQWQRFNDETEKWSNITAATGKSLKVTTNASRQYSEYRVRITNPVKTVYSEIAAVVAISSEDAPFAPETVLYSTDWGFIVSQTETTDDLETGITATAANVEFCYYNDVFEGDPWYDLNIFYQGTDREYYDNAGVFVEGDQSHAPIVEGGDCDSFYATAMVPTQVVYGGNWYIYDLYGYYPFSELYVQGAI